MAEFDPGTAASRCAAFLAAVRLEGSAAAVADGAGGAGCGTHDAYVSRFARLGVCQEAHRAGRLLGGGREASGGTSCGGEAPEDDGSRGGGREGRGALETPVFFEDRARALYAARGATTSEAALEPLRRGRSYRAATRDAGILSREEARELGRTAAAGMLGCFANGGSTVLGCLTPSALASRLGVAAAAQLKWCVVEMRRAAADAARLPPGTCLRLSGAFLARLRPPPPPTGGTRRRCLEASDPRAYWNAHVDSFNVPTYEHTTLLYLSDSGDDFEGGRFVMHDPDGVDRVFAPNAGDLVAFSGDASNLHSVERVTRGARLALTALFHESDVEGPLFGDDADADADADDDAAFSSFDSLLASAAETSLMLQDPRRDDILNRAPPLAPRLERPGAPDLRTDWCHATVDYSKTPEPAARRANASLDPRLLALVDAVLDAKHPDRRDTADGVDDAWGAFGDDDDDDDDDDD